ncbi:MAG: Brp/Blh family beta-carotene 15,15'-dioxygenase [Bacteroidota bacterium]
MNSYYFNHISSLLIILGTLFCVIINYTFSEIYVDILSGFGILTFGIVHGANDLLLINKTTNKTKSIFTQFFIYLTLVLLFFIFFYSIPSLALITFVILSSYHFGEHQWTLFEKTNNNIIKILYFSYGLLIFSILFYFNFNEVSFIIKDITDQSLNLTFFENLLIYSSLTTLIISIMLFKHLKNQLLIQIFLLIFFLVVVYFTDLLMSFAIYFVLWHSLPSILEQSKFLFGSSEKTHLKIYLKKASLYWILSILGLTVTYYIFKDSQSQLLSIFFSFLAAITFPHTFVISKIKKP